MMKRYLMTLKPLEPYFFGNDKTFVYPGTGRNAVARYFIKSENMPAQTTIIGALRYALLPNKRSYGEYTVAELAENASVVGEESFEYGAVNDFKAIKGISPVFLMKGGEKLIVTPFDHKSDTGAEFYSPMTELCHTVDGRAYFNDYNAKWGREQSFTSLSDCRIYKEFEIFRREVRIGINRGVNDDGLFKKEYAAIRGEFSFAAYVLLDGVSPEDLTVYLGQGKSVFKMSFTEACDGEYEAFLSSVASIIPSGRVYLLSDAFADRSLYDKAELSITELRDYRAYKTREGKVKKGDVLFRLLCAGSVFIPKDMDEFMALFYDKSENVIGYNTVIRGEKK